MPCPAHFYLHFRDVEEAVWAVLEDSFAGLMHVMWDVAATNRRRLRYLKWVNVFEFVAENWALMAVVLGEQQCQIVAGHLHCTSAGRSAHLLS